MNFTEEPRMIALYCYTQDCEECRWKGTRVCKKAKKMLDKFYKEKSKYLVQRLGSYKKDL